MDVTSLAPALLGVSVAQLSLMINPQISTFIGEHVDWHATRL